MRPRLYIILGRQFESAHAVVAAANFDASHVCWHFRVFVGLPFGTGVVWSADPQALDPGPGLLLGQLLDLRLARFLSRLFLGLTLRLVLLQGFKRALDLGDLLPNRLDLVVDRRNFLDVGLV